MKKYMKNHVILINCDTGHTQQAVSWPQQFNWDKFDINEIKE